MTFWILTTERRSKATENAVRKIPIVVCQPDPVSLKSCWRPGPRQGEGYLETVCGRRSDSVLQKHSKSKQQEEDQCKHAPLWWAAPRPSQIMSRVTMSLFS